MTQFALNAGRIRRYQSNEGETIWERTQCDVRKAKVPRLLNHSSKAHIRTALRGIYCPFAFYNIFNPKAQLQLQKCPNTQQTITGQTWNDIEIKNPHVRLLPDLPRPPLGYFTSAATYFGRLIREYDDNGHYWQCATVHIGATDKNQFIDMYHHYVADQIILI